MANFEKNEIPGQLHLCFSTDYIQDYWLYARQNISKKNALKSKTSRAYNTKKCIFDRFTQLTEKFTVKSAGIKIPHDFNGEFPIIFSPDQPPKVPIIGKIPHF